MKVCGLCKRKLLLSEFYKRKSGVLAGKLVSHCKLCVKKYGKSWYDRKKLDAQWMKLQTQKSSKWNRDNRESRNQRMNRYYHAEPRKFLERSVRWQQRNKDRVRSKAREWARANVVKMRLKNQRRRAAKRRVKATLTLDEWNFIVKSQNGICVICGIKKKLTIDHKIPLSKGGEHTAANIQGLCHSCNSRKGDKIYAAVGLCLC